MAGLTTRRVPRREFIRRAITVTMKPLNILLLCNRPVKNADASTVTDHLDALINFSEHKITQLSFVRQLPSHVNLARFDVLVIHYTVAIGYMSEHYINQAAKRKIQKFDGLKVVFIQDEYRAVNTVLATLEFLKVDILFTCVPNEEIEKVYPKQVLPGVIKVNTLTGYVPSKLLAYQAPRITERKNDVGYRTRKPPYWLGQLGHEKWQISDRFQELTQDKGLTLDLSYDESRRIYGEHWIKFVASCKTMLGVESGASVFDFEGHLQRQVDMYVSEHPDATFQEVQNKFLHPYEGLIRLNQISPRCFEAAALRTVLVLFEGEYSGILQPWRHFIPLKKDFSNLEQVVAKIKDNHFLQEMADRTYEEVANNPRYSYKTFVLGFDKTISEAFVKTDKIPVVNPYTPTQYNMAIALSVRFTVRRLLTASLQRVLLGTGIRSILFKIWGNVPLNARSMLRPLLRIVGR